jgi:hypothetical protein
MKTKLHIILAAGLLFGAAGNALAGDAADPAAKTLPAKAADAAKANAFGQKGAAQRAAHAAAQAAAHAAAVSAAQSAAVAHTLPGASAKGQIRSSLGPLNASGAKPTTVGPGTGGAVAGLATATSHGGASPSSPGKP